VEADSETFSRTSTISLSLRVAYEVSLPSLLPSSSSVGRAKMVARDATFFFFPLVNTDGRSALSLFSSRFLVGTKIVLLFFFFFPLLHHATDRRCLGFSPRRSRRSATYFFFFISWGRAQTISFFSLGTLRIHLPRGVCKKRRLPLLRSLSFFLCVKS